MKQEERKLLLTDLCGRIPYNTKVLFVYSDGTSETSEMGLGGLHDIRVGDAEGKPFLRPMSSMSKVEKQDYAYITERWMYDAEHTISESIDWLNERHFDHRGLIGMGLALEAPEGMYE